MAVAKNAKPEAQSAVTQPVTQRGPARHNMHAKSPSEEFALNGLSGAESDEIAARTRSSSG